MKALKINLPSVLREVKARDQNVQISGYLLSHATRSRRWKKKWFIVYNLVLYEFEKHEVRAFYLCACSCFCISFLCVPAFAYPFALCFCLLLFFAYHW